MALPLVFMLPKSTCLLFPGNENRSPGCSSTNNTTPISTGPQSAISSCSEKDRLFSQNDKKTEEIANALLLCTVKVKREETRRVFERKSSRFKIRVIGIGYY
ncbi:hypothetical protein LWI28_024112 [Acer negundo]|uniref:Uncharacterized protein n=1 Tax=Acer negundo TaxID=4023 RepID=A0AAD5NSY2_ACENE|nr:hypothetical protein LWI28_024112 [Acer negundo]